VFRGRLNGQDVAVKRILEEKRFQVGEDAYQHIINQFIIELQTMHSYPAENILPLLAISFDPAFLTEPCLVYQLMPNGSVSDHLKLRDGTPPLTWQQRANIALGTARGLQHLHGNNIIHGDIKSGNILLDKHFEPKIGKGQFFPFLLPAFSILEGAAYTSILQETLALPVAAQKTLTAPS